MALAFATFALSTALMVAAHKVDASTPSASVPASIAPGLRAWSLTTGFSFFGRKTDLNSPDAGMLLPTDTAMIGLPFDLFAQNWKGQIRLHLDDSGPDGLVTVIVGQEYGVEIAINGHGRFVVGLFLFDSDRTQIGSMPFVTFEMSEKQQQRTVGKRFHAPPQTKFIQPVFFMSGTTELKIESVAFEPIN